MPKLQTPFHLEIEINYLRRKVENEASRTGEQPTLLIRKLEKLEEQLKQSLQKRLKLLVETLKTQPDIYASGVRIYTFEHPWTLTDEGKLFHGDTEYQPDTLTNGHGRSILKSITW